MNKQGLIEHLTHNCGLHRASAIAAVNGMFQAIAAAVSAGEDVVIRDFGIFKVRNVAEKVGRNIATKEPVTIPAHKTVKFLISYKLKETLNS